MAGNPPYSALEAVQNAASPDAKYCFGFESANTQGYYITTTKLSTGKVSINKLENKEGLLGIVAYDRAERNDAYLGQVNMIEVSSFSGPYSAIWGYDMAKAILRSADNYLFEVPQETPPFNKIPVFKMDPLLSATQDLFGTEDDRHFPVVAGGHLPTAVKYSDSIDPITKKSAPGWVWCYLALAIAENREKDASLFVEDTGFDPDFSKTDAEMETFLEDEAHKVADSQIICGKNQSVPFKEIFISWRKLLVNEGEYGTALTCAPYVTLAQNAYPTGTSTEERAQQLIDMSLDQWRKSASWNAK